ncbi:MAG TPA: hypothetical protein VHV31_10865 [Nitrolancea sp.]|jgi:uncharacterized membrane protein|nr:hypothetical protein [Nitrolancea sp.]
MSNETWQTGETENVTILTVPTEHVQAVHDFVTSLTTTTEDVTGHMISRGGIGGASGSALGGFSGTFCSTSTTGGSMDINCTDTDFASRLG